MPKLRIIARYADGRMVKGHTENFNPMAAVFNIHPVDQPNASPNGVLVHTNQLKAIFIVKFFEGHAPQNPDTADTTVASPCGLVLKVKFKDGEELEGTTMNYDPSAIGFFLFPIDPNSNNDRVYVVNNFVDSVEPIDMAKAG